ncbi:MAG TPA: SOS response-associated peptidase [Streptosporangiaceae bacterium]|nr:SOS response-associated peptidase [Streptosporangiaceae bacterium]
MCGRYASTRARQELLDEFQVELDASEDALEPDYNVAPTKSVPAVIKRAPKGDEGEDETPVRMLRKLRWGLVPSWAKDPKIGARMINARVETVHEKPAYRRAFARRRCLLPADGFYEWYEIKVPEGKPRKQPFFIRPRDGGVMAMAGLYELWRDPEGEWVWTCTVITTAATDEVGRIHDRMPMIVEPKLWAAWLDPDLTDTDEVRRLLVPAMEGRMEAYPVSTAVNNVRNNGPSLVEPLPDGDISGEYGATLF